MRGEKIKMIDTPDSSKEFKLNKNKYNVKSDGTISTTSVDIHRKSKNLLDLFNELTEDEKIQFINLLIDVINDCGKNQKPSSEYTIVCSWPHIAKY